MKDTARQLIRRIAARLVRRIARSPSVRGLLAENPPVSSFAPAGTFRAHTGQEFTILSGYRDQIVPRWRHMVSPEPRREQPDPIEIASARAAVALLDRILTLFNRSLTGLSVLEVGCHGGLHAYALAEHGATVDAIDVPGYGVISRTGTSPTADELLRQSQQLQALRRAGAQAFAAEHSHQVAFHDLDVAELKAESRYDLVVSWETLEHLPDPRRAVLRMSAALKPDGLMFHEYNPFFAADGGHSLCTLDFPYGHVVLDDEAFAEYVRQFRPVEADRAIAFHQRALNRMSLDDLSSHLAHSGLSVVAILPWLERHDLTHIDDSTLTAMRALHPTSSLTDLLARRVWVVARNPR